MNDESGAGAISDDGAFGRWSVSRDAAGIPTAIGDSVGAMAFAQGYATAQDRLWQMEWDRRRGDGTTASITGRSDHAVNDGFFLRARVAEAAQRGFADFVREDPATADLCRAFVAGVNTRLATGAPLSAPFRRLDVSVPQPFEPWHVISIFIVRHLNFATWQTKLWNARVAAALGPAAIPRFCTESAGNEAPLIVPSGAIESLKALDSAMLASPREFADLAALAPLGLSMNGSNAWAVHGNRTASGRPLIAGDPHRALECPNVYQQIRLLCREQGIDAAGFAFPGVPGVMHFGQTAHTAWAVTNAMADYQDLYVERLPQRIIDERTEEVAVRGHAPVRIQCLVTERGPVVLGDTSTGVGLAIAATGLDSPGQSIRAVLPQLRAQSVADLDEAMRCWVEPVNNFVMADARGDGGTIGYRTAGRVPIRRHPAAHWIPVPGDDNSYGWDGAIPDADLPRTDGDGRGVIVTANQRITSADYPYIIGIDPAGGHRANRILERLGGRMDLAADDMAAIHTDVVSLPGRRFAAVAAGAGGALSGWDGEMSMASTQATTYTAARVALGQRVLSHLPPSLADNPFTEWEPPATCEPALTRTIDALAGWIAADDTSMLPDGASWQQWCADAVAVADAEARAGEGGGASSWGSEHHLRPLLLGERSRLDLGPVAGAQDCVMATNEIAGLTNSGVVGSTARYVWDLADRSQSGWIVPTGADEDDSAHRLDQAEHYRAGTLLPVWTTGTSDNGTIDRVADGDA